jgi:DNA-binding response OmpR family regulator
VVAVPLLTYGSVRQPADTALDGGWEPPRAVTIGAGALPSGLVAALADDSIVLDAYQLEILSRLPPPEVVLVAPGANDPSALAIVRGVRHLTGAPVIALLDASSERERIGVLHAGADDCVDARIGIGELFARLEAIGRRGRRAVAVEAGSIALDHDTRQAWAGSVPLELTRREFDLLAYLVAAPRRVFSREQLLRAVWGTEQLGVDPATVTEHVRRLRTKLADAGGSRACIRTLRGVGYRFEPERCTAGCRPEDVVDR